ncbi:cryptochrome/photolyase family protein [Alkalilimnicola sp. S0819]|uniref:cryptochrome/photolyase family protein n=1 Tax=Alkalilimnicola sp. S0819 TaxID=2613922 RepID=UPI001261AB1B|nr:deoxyribodipyrimidine photo-lyase [Alkalilimnicola sp. S0819]KAB7624069.1 deoxyribodipyrimidine photo-lyase [Alkalilimnicola sp. S0819]MPQ16319.1 deoxyribodipyrimidine photo-lyase [Alkalilimnicola sp. S0819]
MPESPILVWLRRDLRLTDNPALNAAARRGPVLPVYIHALAEEAPWAPGAASRWWLHHSLAALTEALAARGLPLVLRQGPSLQTLQALVRETGARELHWNRLYEPAIIARDKTIKAALRAQGLRVTSHQAALLREPWELRNRQGKPYRVYTPFWREARRGLSVGDPEPLPDDCRGAEAPASEPLQALALLPRIRWEAGLAERWRPGEAAALARLRRFAARGLRGYAERRELPAEAGTSGLSPALHFGELGPRQILAELQGLPEGEDRQRFIAELGWREFAHHLLFHFPRLPDEPINERFKAFPWQPDEARLRAWQRGRTGIPLVDAGLRELWHSGWMHNRVRMVVGSLLVKNLGQPWQAGARWFWDTLVDADLANNSMGWQWVAGCGADAAPFFRIFNPVRQGERFDPEGAYLRHWLPELARLPTRWLHQPWAAPGSVLAEAGVRLGREYPEPMVDLGESRRAALEAYRRLP